jgi:hypothetical protein
VRERKVSALLVLDAAERVIGIVWRADLPRKEEFLRDGEEIAEGIRRGAVGYLFPGDVRFGFAEDPHALGPRQRSHRSRASRRRERQEAHTI